MTNWPTGSKTVKPAVSSKYGPRIGGAFSFHYGTDFTGYDLVKTIAAGRVTFAGFLNPQAGNAVSYDLTVKGSKGETITVVHMHLQRIAVRAGQILEAGRQVGTMGASGNATGRCDHVEIRYWSGGKYTTVDPEKWIPARIKTEAAAAAALKFGVKKTTKVELRARSKPSTSAPVKQVYDKGDSGFFDAYTHGTKVSGNDVWFRNKKSKLWSWSGGYTSKSTKGLKKVS